MRNMCSRFWIYIFQKVGEVHCLGIWNCILIGFDRVKQFRYVQRHVGRVSPSLSYANQLSYIVWLSLLARWPLEFFLVIYVTYDEIFRHTFHATWLVMICFFSEFRITPICDFSRRSQISRYYLLFDAICAIPEKYGRCRNITHVIVLYL